MAAQKVTLTLCFINKSILLNTRRDHLVILWNSSTRMKAITLFSSIQGWCGHTRVRSAFGTRTLAQPWLTVPRSSHPHMPAELLIHDSYGWGATFLDLFNSNQFKFLWLLLAAALGSTCQIVEVTGRIAAWREDSGAQLKVLSGGNEIRNVLWSPLGRTRTWRNYSKIQVVAVKK